MFPRGIRGVLEEFQSEKCTEMEGIRAKHKKEMELEMERVRASEAAVKVPHIELAGRVAGDHDLP